MLQERLIEDLFNAVDSGDLETATELLNSFGPSNLPAWSEGCTLLLRAIRNGHTEIAELLLKNNCKVNDEIFPQNVTTPLHIAASIGDLKIIQILVDRQAKIDALDEDLNTPLMKAIEIGLNEFNESTYETSCEIIELLVKNGADIHANESGKTPLEQAIDNPQIEFIKVLLENSTNPNAENKLNKFIFTLGDNDSITSLDRTAIAKLLLNHGAIPEGRNHEGETPLHLAVRNIDIAFAKLLIDNNVDINAADDDGTTPLHYASMRVMVNDEKEDPIALINMLLEMGADPNLYDLNGFTALHNCVTNNPNFEEIKCEERIRIVENFLSHGADFNGASIIDGKRGHELLFFATLSKCGTDFMEYLLTKGADVNAGYDYTSTPLYVAAQNGDAKSVRFLLDHGAKPYPEGPNGENVLDVAVESRRPRVVETILKSCYANSENTSFRVKMEPMGLGEQPFFEGLERWFRSRAGRNDGITENQYRTFLNKLFEDAYNYDITFDSDDESDVNDDDEAYSLRVDGCSQWNRFVSFEMWGEKYYYHPTAKLNRNEAEIVKLLLSHGIHIDFMDYDNRTLLGYAIKYNDMEVVQLCLSSQTNVNVNDFMVAVAMGKRDIVDMLLMHDPRTFLCKPSIDLYNEILRYAVSKTWPFIDEPGLIIDDDAKDDIAILFISKAPEKICFSVLLSAAENNRLKVVEFLLKNKDLVDEVREVQGVLISAAARYNRLDLAELILECGINVDEAFYDACANGHSQMAEFLLKSGACMRKAVDEFFFDSSGCPEIRSLIKRHIIRTIGLRGSLSGAVLQQYEEITSNPALIEFVEQCKEEETAKMRNKMIGDSNICFYDIVEKGRDQIAMCTKNENICEAMKSSDLAEEFPLHHGVMMDNFLKGKKRAPLLDSAEKVIHSLGRWEIMPKVPIDNLFSYLDDEDLKKLIKAGPRRNL